MTAEYFIVHDGQDHVLLADGQFDGTVAKRHTRTWVSDHKGLRIFHENGQTATFANPKTGVDHVGRGVDPYQDAAYTEEHPIR